MNTPEASISSNVEKGDEAPPSEPTTVPSVSTAPPKIMRVNPGAVDWPDERLLDVRMSDLDIAIP
ncbi:MAG TPA: hypothetical protein VMT89_01625, partial [Candidatus Acidoferrales bacterium]|nr:hypothetical protein [Candidatus Acidoferrales bacterium]